MRVLLESTQYTPSACTPIQPTKSAGLARFHSRPSRLGLANATHAQRHARAAATTKGPTLNVSHTPALSTFPPSPSPSLPIIVYGPPVTMLGVFFRPRNFCRVWLPAVSRRLEWGVAWGTEASAYGSRRGGTVGAPARRDH